MANIRREFGDDLSFKNGNLGINTTTTQERVDVVGVVKGRDLNVTGVTSLTAYEGFLRADHQIAENTTLSFDQGPVSSLSGEIIVGTGVTVTIASVGLGTTMVGNGSGTIENTIDTTDINLAGGSQIECLKVYNTFTPPSGGTNERPYKPKPGELYYNYDFKTIEFYDGYGWRQVDNTTKSSRGICAGGEPTVSDICLFNINTLGSSRNFGDLTASRANLGAVSSGTRGIFAGGEPATDLIQYITIASEGNAIDFDGNLTASRRFVTGCSSSTRGLFMGGAEPSTRVNKIDYIEMATAGVNAQDFGDLTETKDAGGGGSWSNGVRGGIFGGFNPGNSNRIDVVTIASKGNAVNFGTTIESRHNVAAASNNVRAIAAGGSPETVRTIQYITMASDGNASYFGDLTTGTTGMNACANGTRIVWSGGNTSPAKVTTQQYVNIASAGNALDFGDISYVGVQQPGCLSDSHGGLGGF